MRVKMGGSSSTATTLENSSGEDSMNVSHLPFSLGAAAAGEHQSFLATEGDYYIDIHGSVVARIAARFEAGFGGQYPPSSYSFPSCLKKASSSPGNKKKYAVSFSDAPQVFDVERFNDSYFIIDDYDDDHHHDDDDEEEDNEARRPSVSQSHERSPIAHGKGYLPDDMFTPEESSPRKHISMSNQQQLFLPTPPLMDEKDNDHINELEEIHDDQENMTDSEEARQEFRNASTIQRIVRGWYERKHFYVLLLQFRLDTIEQRTLDEISVIQKDMLHQKHLLKKQTRRDSQQTRKRFQQTKTVARESQRIVAFLRQENEHLRDRITEFEEGNFNLAKQNERLEHATQQSDDVVKALHDYIANQKITHERLVHETLPDYKAAIDVLQQALQEREWYCLAETKIKLGCRKTIAYIVDRISNCDGDDELTELIMDLALDCDSSQSMSDSTTSWNGQGSFSQMLDRWGRRSLSQMSQESLANGLSVSVGALRFESDSDDEDVKRYAARSNRNCVGAPGSAAMTSVTE
ncbi:hypothetical protein MPSEU_001070300 [Mayamaea pseudoterrestris]|nr:hypothetical protein MPSEU_001070300 [Mayamaea pseudoterrestris]